MNKPLSRHVLYLFAVFFFGFGLAASSHPALAASQDIGKVIAYTAGASVLREGKTEDLALHAGIMVSDTIQTDATGRVKILFNDDTSVSVGPGTSMDMSEYADAGSDSAFSVNLTQGLVRVITGKIVDQNPGGFKMTTPEATVGIRGTIVSLRRQGNSTTAYVENTLRRVLVNGANVPSGNKWIHSGGSSRQERISPEDRRALGRDLAFRGGQGAAAAAPEASPERGRRSTEQLVAAGESRLPKETLKDNASVAQSLLARTDLPASLPVTPTTATLSGSFTHDGSLSHPQILSFSGNFTLSVNLSTGNVTGSQISATGTEWGPYSFSLSAGGGTGYVDSRGFMVTGFSGAFSSPSAPPGMSVVDGPLGSTSFMSGARDAVNNPLPGGPVDISSVNRPVSGYYGFDSVYGRAAGTFSGSRTR